MRDQTEKEMSSLSPTKTQFYSANGAGRDSYIYGNNGGFVPSTEPCKIEALGKSNTLNIQSSSHNQAWMIFIDMIVYLL